LKNKRPKVNLNKIINHGKGNFLVEGEAISLMGKTAVCILAVLRSSQQHTCSASHNNIRKTTIKVKKK
jgi:uncharacterized Zn-binding protein involved in type VI secretion